MNLIPFEYEAKQVRVVQDEHGEPWWIAKDVCDVLELTDVGKSVEKLDDDEKLIRKIFVSGQNREMWTINEPGLYSLILRSNKPEAKNFKRWITHKVLPSIRKSGKYEIESTSELDLIIQSAQELKKIKSKQTEHDQRIKQLEAKTHKNSGDTGYWTIAGWCKRKRLNLPIRDAKRYGREATRMSKEKGVPIGTVPDERFGNVNSYPENLLEKIFTMPSP